MMARIAALTLLLVALPAAAALDPECAATPVAPAPGPSLRPFSDDLLEQLRQNAPLRALDRACARLRAEGERADVLLELAQALLALSRGDGARRVLGALPAVVDGDALLRARTSLVLAELEAHEQRQAAALPHVEQALLLADGPQAAALALRQRALVLQAQVWVATARPEALARAEANLAEVERLLMRAGTAQSRRMSEVMNARTMLAMAHSKFSDVERWARAEWLLLRRLDGRDAPSQLDAIASLGAIISSQRRYRETIEVLEEGRRIGRLHPTTARSAYIGILDNLSPSLIDLGRVEQALAVSEEAVAAAVAHWGRGSLRTLTPLGRRSFALETLQRYAEAARDHEEILAVLEREGAQTRLERRLRLLDGAAAFSMRMNDLDEAQRRVRQGLDLIADGRGGAYWRGRIVGRHGRLAAERERWAEADEAYGQAVELMTPAYGNGHPYLTQVHARRCEAQLRLGADAAACAEVQAGLERLEEGGAHDRASARLALAGHAAASGRRDDAVEHLLHALAAAQADDGRGALWLVLDRLATALRERGGSGNAALAIVLGKSAVVEIEKVRRGLRGAALQRELEPGYLKDKHRVYRRLADWLAEDGRIDEAMQVQRLLKGEELSDFVRGWSPELLSPAAAQLLWSPSEAAWLRRSPLNEVQRRIEAGFSMQQRAAKERQRAAGWALALARLPVAGIVSNTRTSRPAGAASGIAAATPVPPGELHVTMFLGPAHLNQVLDSAAGRRVLRQPLDVRELSRDVGALLARIEARDEVLPALRSLYRRVAADLDAESKRIGARIWRLQLDGDLRYLPFAALHDGQAHLVERLLIVQRIGTTRRETKTAAPGAAQRTWINAFGSARAAPGFKPLPGVMDELCAIVDGALDGREGQPCTDVAAAASTRLPGRGWLNEAFTRERLRWAFADGRRDRLDVLHVGTHFLLRPGNMSLSWFLLGNGGRLPLHEMLRWPLLSQELVTLSACQTAMGGGAEVDGLPALLLARGAQAVVASLWQVGDQSTPVLMRAMYAAIAQGADAGEALRSAQLQLIGLAEARYRHPFHWAAFVVSSGSP